MQSAASFNASHNSHITTSNTLLFAIFQVYKTVLEACNQEDLQLPILDVRDVKKVSLVVVTGDRGLCGSYNSAVIKAATRRLNKLKEQGIDVCLFPFFSS